MRIIFLDNILRKNKQLELGIERNQSSYGVSFITKQTSIEIEHTLLIIYVFHKVLFVYD